jgi:hypothetical protein
MATQRAEDNTPLIRDLRKRYKALKRERAQDRERLAQFDVLEAKARREDFLRRVYHVGKAADLPSPRIQLLMEYAEEHPDVDLADAARKLAEAPYYGGETT